MIYITHDIDWLSPLHPYSILKVFTHGNKWITLNQALNKNLFIDQIERLISFNNNSQSVWLCGAPSSNSLQKKGLRYTSKNNKLLQVINLLKQSNTKIGLHSIASQSLTQQTLSLTALTQQPIRFHRSHYLKFNPSTLFPQLQSNGILTDFSNGQPRKVSMPPTSNQTQNGIKIIPTILFDNAFFFNNPEQVLADFKQSITQAKVNNIDVAILFHPENFAVNPRLWEYYEEILNIIKHE